MSTTPPKLEPSNDELLARFLGAVQLLAQDFGVEPPTELLKLHPNSSASTFIDRNVKAVLPPGSTFTVRGRQYHARTSSSCCEQVRQRLGLPSHDFLPILRGTDVRVHLDPWVRMLRDRIANNAVPEHNLFLAPPR